MHFSLLPASLKMDPLYFTPFASAFVNVLSLIESAFMQSYLHSNSLTTTFCKSHCLQNI